jgi:hypothetical protein
MSDGGLSALLAQLDPRDREYVESLEDVEEQRTIVTTILRHHRPDRLDRGQPIPALELLRLDGVAVDLEKLVSERPLVLIFGSYT